MKTSRCKSETSPDSKWVLLAGGCALLLVMAATPIVAQPRESADKSTDKPAVKSSQLETRFSTKTKTQTNRSAERKTQATSIESIPKLGSKLLTTTWDRWQSLKPGQRKKYIETLRRFTQAPPEKKKVIKDIAELKRTSPGTLNRLQRLLPKLQAFVRSLTPSEAARLRAMTPQERAREISQHLVRKRLQQKDRPTAPATSNRPGR